MRYRSSTRPLVSSVASRSTLLASLLLASSSSLAAQSGAPWTAEADVANARFGTALSSAGDVNGDGFADVIIGAPGYGSPGLNQDEEGRAYVFHGSASGLSADPVWSVESNQPWAGLGFSVSTAGDVNGDGYADVIVGIPFYLNGTGAVGRVEVYHGSTSGLSLTPDWIAEGDQVSASFGWSVSTAGDVDGDGYSDVIIGAPEYSNGEDSEGRAFVYHGSSTGLEASPAWTAESNSLEACFGHSASTAGDVDGDGYSDIIVGAPYFTDDPYYQGTGLEEGKAFVYHGSALGVSAVAAWTRTGSGGGLWGLAVSGAGDLNGDGFSDVAIGEPWWGEAQVRYGSATGIGGGGFWIYSDSWIGLGPGPGLGWSLAGAGDLNGDGFDELLIGAPGHSNGQKGEGIVYVFQGAAGGLPATETWSVESNQAGAALFAVAGAGDVNGDGFDDLLAGAPRFDNGESKEGRAFLYDGSLPRGATVYCTAGTSANGCTASISGTGTASATATSGFTLTTTGVEGAKNGIYFFGTQGRQASAWGSGTSFQCVVPPVKRAAVLVGGGTSGSCDGVFAFDLNALWCATCPKPTANPGFAAVVQAQLWYRDPLNTSNQTTSLSDAVEFVLGQ